MPPLAATAPAATTATTTTTPPAAVAATAATGSASADREGRKPNVQAAGARGVGGGESDGTAAAAGSGPASAPTSAAKVSVVLPRRSVLVLNDAARYSWTHAIATRKTDLIGDVVKPRGVRTSLTFRTVRHEPCDCNFKAYCDRNDN